MALSGSFYKNVGSHWRLQVEWSGSQSISGNYTNITAKMYWIARDGYGAVYSSATKTSALQHNNGSWHTESGALAKLSANQKKLINTYSFRVNHNADGTASFSLDGYFDAEVTLSGTYYGRIDLDQKSFTLNTIPRKSSLSSSRNWTAGNNLAISVSRASSSFTHTAKIYVDNVLIKTITGIGTSTTASFSTTENTNIFKELAGGSSKGTKIELTTYSGSTNIGTNTYTGTVSAPHYNTTSYQTKSIKIGQSITGNVTKYLSGTTSKIQYIFGGTTYTLYEGSNTSWTYDTNKMASSLYAKIPNDRSIDGVIRIYTYYNGVQVNGYGESAVTATVVNSEPTFSASSISYKDTTTATKGLTGNDQYIIQNQSNLTAYVNTSATARNGASLVKYIVSVGSNEKEITTATGSVSLGKINESVNQSLEVKAVDSRGFTTTVSKTVLMLAYESPKLVAKLERQNKFEDTTRIDITGSFSTITVGGVKKNLVQSLAYSYKQKGASSWQVSSSPISFTTSGDKITGKQFALTLDNTKAWDFQFTVSDKITNVNASATVGVGSPILFVDSEKKSVGIGKFPTETNSLEVAGRVMSDKMKLRMLYGTHIDDIMLQDHSNGNVTLSALGDYLYLGYKNTSAVRLYSDLVGRGTKKILDADGKLLEVDRISLGTSQYADSTGGAGLDLNNSDIIGLNSMYFNDEMTSNNEALQFPKSGFVEFDKSTYDSFRVYNGTGFLNEKPIFTSDNEVLWEGALYMKGDQNVTPSKSITNCPNGWILVWSHYSGGTAGDYDWNYTVVPKSHKSGTGVWAIVGTHFDGITGKYVYVSNGSISGNNSNTDSTGERNTVVLRKVVSY
jgi:Siphovirus protein of unknown function (DUF859)